MINLKSLPFLLTSFFILFQFCGVFGQKLMVSINATSNFFCPGGSVTINSAVINAKGTVLYSWDTPAGFSGNRFKPSIEANAAGTYRLMVESLDEIDFSNTEEINETSVSPITISPAGGSYCEGGNKLILSAVSAAFVEDYVWNVPSGFTGDLNSVSIVANAPGTYSVTANGAQCNVTSKQVNVSEYSIGLSLTANDPSEFDGSNGYVNVNVSSGIAPYSWRYSKNGGANVFGNASQEPFNITGLAEGNYTITVTDANNCPSSQSSALMNPPCEITFIKDIEPPTCHNGTDGSITVTISNGAAPFSISWTGPVSSGISTTSTKYTIQNLPAGNYEITIIDDKGCMTSMNAIVSNPAPINVSIVGDLVFCPEDGGTILSTSPGSFSTYLWSNGTTGSSLPVSSSGTYSVTVTNAAGCIATASVSVTKLSALNISLNSSLSMLSESCPGSCDGALFVNVSGGSGTSYSYSWIGPGGYNSSLEDISSLCPGKYDLTVVDSEGCMDVFSGTIASVTPMQLTLSATNPTCEDTGDGTLIANFSGGVSNYNISWSGAESGSTSNISSPHAISNLIAGNYTVTVSDGNGCMIVGNRTINSTLPFTFNASELSPSCQGSNTGSILVSNISNGTGPYTITWQQAGGGEDSDVTLSTSYTIDGLLSGSYTIIVKDANGCDHTISSVIVGEQSEINVDIVGDLVFCSDQTNGILTTNPSSFASWTWSTGATDASIMIGGPGTYSVTVTDAGGCTGRNEVTVVQAPDIALSTSAANSVLMVSCSDICDGMISPNVSGGIGAPYTYSWTGPSGFVSSSINIDNLCAGNYVLTVLDGNGCTNSYAQEITNSSSLEIDLDPQSASCAGEADGSISSIVTGGALPYSFLWSNGSTSEDIEDLVAGTYALTVTDANGCNTSSSVIVGEAAAINGMINPSSGKICIGESIDLKASGGVSYLWNNGASSSSISVSPTETTEYFVTITGSTSSCAVVKSATVIVNDQSNAGILINENSGLNNNDGDICNGSQVKLTATGGVSYMWQGGVANPLEISPVATETFSVTITDGDGCNIVLSETIVVNQKPTAEIDLSEANQILDDIQIVKNASAANCGSLINCVWEIDNANSANSCTDQEFTFDELGSYEIGLRVENSCGCVDEVSKTIDIVPANGCKINLFSINDGFGEACVDQAVSIDFDNVPTEGCSIFSSQIQVMRNGILVDNYSFVNGFITFFEEGTYEVRYEIEDDCNCSRFVTREMTIVSAPGIAFADVNFLVGCAGEGITINLSGYDFGEKVTVIVNGVEKVYETDKFEVFISEPGNYDVSIVSVSNQFCDVGIVGQKLTIQIIEPLRIDQRIVTCDDDGSYTLTLVTSGGGESATISSSLGGIQNGNNFVINNLDPNFGFQFDIWKGTFCDPIVIVQPVVSCNCLFNQGDLIDDDYFVDCAGEFFDISNLYSGTDASNPITDTLLYILHDGFEENSLGVVYEIYPISQAFITNDFSNYTPNKRYMLSVVGIRKFDFFNLSGGALSDFDFRSQDDCFSVSIGVPVIWHGAQVSISGPNQVCENAYNEIFVSAGIGDGAEIDIVIPGLTGENYAFDQTDGKLYVHFINDTEALVPIQITSTTKHQDLIRDEVIETTCVSSVDYEVKIDQAHAAPDTSGLILWPGGIFASLDTLENICYRWGKTTRVTNTIVEDTVFAGANERFYYADLDDVEGLNERRQIWVETYFCDDSLCATRNIYNGLFPISLGGDFDESGMTIYPNPTDGFTNFTIKNQFEGSVAISIYDIRGRQILATSFDKTGFISKKTLDLDKIPKGMYVVRVVYGNQVSFIEKLVKQ